MSAGFTALNGLETLEVIMTRIRKALVDTGEFKQNLSFPLFRLDFDVKVWSYPKQPLTGEPGIRITAQVGDDTTDLPLVNISVDNTVDTPDKERLDSGLEIPAARPSGGGVIVDIPQDQPKVPTKAESIQAAIKAAQISKEK